MSTYIYFTLLTFSLFGSHSPVFAAPSLFVQSRPAMGTTFTIYLYASDADQAAEDFEAAFDEVERLEEALSNYRPSSEVSRINRFAARERVTTDAEIFNLLRTSLEYSQRTQGAFDITVGHLMRAWGFFRGNGHYPANADIAQAKASVGWQKVHLCSADRTVHFTTPGVELDLGAIGKGYAVDRIVTVLREQGVTSALVDAGSSTLYALGAPPGESGWKVRVPRSNDHSETLSTAVLRDASLSTSGCSEKSFQLKGHTYCHIMDPRTGSPVEGVLQTTVIAADGTTTDALSTSIFVMGPSEGEKLLETISGTSAIWVVADFSAPRVISSHWPGCISAGDPLDCKK
jgi:thiamine biosynthesis lipoprotein